jgi:hypothetical protein
VITYDGTAVRSEVSRESAQVTTLESDTQVEVLEVIAAPEQQRIRAKIKEPQGWISLVSTEDGYRWANPLHQAAFPHGWESAWSEEYQCEYYFNRATGVSTWTKPQVDEMEVRIQPHSLAFPQPLLQMPYELDRAKSIDYIHHDADENLVRVSLPIYVRAEVFTPSRETECILIATHNRRGFQNGGDGLTAYGAVHRTDFSFRTQVFNTWPQHTRRHALVKLKARQWNEMSIALSEHEATYWINGVHVASVTLGHADLPAKDLYIGFVSYQAPYMIRRFDVSRDPRMLKFVCSEQELNELYLFREHILTLHGVALDNNADAVSVICTNIAGNEVANFVSLPARSRLKDFRDKLAEWLQLNDFDKLRLVLRDGTLIREADDTKLLSTALGLAGT